MSEQKAEEKKPDPAVSRAAEKREAVKAAEQAKDSGPVVAPGKAITSKRGVLVAGDVVTVKDFKGGQSTFDSLKSKGYIVSK